MKICVLNGSPKGKRSSTYHLYTLFLDQLKQKEDVEIVEFIAKNDFPDHCTGCDSCIIRHENLCPHREKVAPIEKAILEADLLVFISPVYVMSLSGRMKTLLDHFGYWFNLHRPREEFKSKTAMIFSTAAGDGTKFAIENIKRVLKFWGIPSIKTYGKNLYALNIKELLQNNPTKYEKIKKEMGKKANSVYKAYKRRHKQRYRFSFHYHRIIMKPIIKNYPEDNVDRKYWVEHGWIKD